MTDEQLDALEALHAATTPGEWYAFESGVMILRDEEPREALGNNDRDWLFIATAHEAIPLLIANIRNLKAEIARLKNAENTRTSGITGAAW